MDMSGHMLTPRILNGSRTQGSIRSVEPLSKKRLFIGVLYESINLQVPPKNGLELLV